MSLTIPGRERDKPMTTTAAAKHVGVKPQTISMWAARGKLTPAGHDDRGRPIYWMNDVARVEKSTRRAARRNVGLRTIATHEIADEDAVLVRLKCGHLKILSAEHAPDTGRPVGCFECAALSAIDYQLATRRVAAA
ncbi:MerR family transcriptional regulator [Streptomyces phaeochromogenes]|uniref:MerR family transcriptional regulator n=1 Tax=Streptomyces phaeochromogenes TaxID=1923 RepID=UPI00368E518F